MDALPVIFSLSGLGLKEEERLLFKSANPLGFILFARNCENPKQVRDLTDALKNAVGRDCPVLIDQEGGRVQRLKPPAWPQYPPLKSFGDMAADDMPGALEKLRRRTCSIAGDLKNIGVSVNCDPVLDVLTPSTHDVIGDRSFSGNADIVARLGLAVCRHYLEAGITPVIKHMPGHGRTRADSHKEVPVVDASLRELRESDFHPFRIIAESDIGPAVWGMPTPVLYTALDANRPACVSKAVIQKTIREDIGFKGVLVSDALDMGGFDGCGDAPGRVKAVLDAGCDLALHCTGKLDEMEAIAATAPAIRKDTLNRLQKAAEFSSMAA
ncbi:MAG: beta-N-acetylhexosaminidase [Alphaproteobacteria bacterium]|nr:beta-N-acetylhexosaminidase [Alphaproteobacteria bacterium]